MFDITPFCLGTHRWSDQDTQSNLGDLEIFCSRDTDIKTTSMSNAGVVSQALLGEYEVDNDHWWTHFLHWTPRVKFCEYPNQPSRGRKSLPYITSPAVCIKCLAGPPRAASALGSACKHRVGAAEQLYHLPKYVDNMTDFDYWSEAHCYMCSHTTASERAKIGGLETSIGEEREFTVRIIESPS